jgi:nitroreductase
MNLFEVIRSRRSIRQFKPDPIARETLKRLVDAGRLAPSAANLQPLEFVIVDDQEGRNKIFSCLKWAAYIVPSGNPLQGQEPVAYIIVLVNLKIREKGFEYDAGASIENMILVAREESIGSCWLISIDREKIAEVLGVPQGYRVDAVLALGHPAEEPIAEDMTDSIKYWKDDSGRLHVPKRKLDSIVHFNKF